MQSFFGDAGQVEFTDRTTLFVDQAVQIVKHILESPQESEDLSLVTSFESLIILFMKFISQLLGNSVALKIKKNMCTLLELMMNQRQYISFKHENDFRNYLVEAVVEWTSDFSGVRFSLFKFSHFNLFLQKTIISTSGPEPLSSSTSEKGLADNPAAKEAILTKKLLKELDVACIASVASLLRALPLPADTQQVKFSKYFTFFTTLLTRCKQDVCTFSSTHASIEGAGIFSML